MSELLCAFDLEIESLISKAFNKTITKQQIALATAMMNLLVLHGVEFDLKMYKKYFIQFRAILKNLPIVPAPVVPEVKKFKIIKKVAEPIEEIEIIEEYEETKEIIQEIAESEETKEEIAEQAEQAETMPTQSPVDEIVIETKTTSVPVTSEIDWDYDSDAEEIPVVPQVLAKPTQEEYDENTASLNVNNDEYDDDDISDGESIDSFDDMTEEERAYIAESLDACQEKYVGEDKPDIPGVAYNEMRKADPVKYSEDRAALRNNMNTAKKKRLAQALL